MNPFIGEIAMFGGNFAPRNWAFCNGQLLAISQNTALFSILGTTYGGDGRTTFALPDLRGRAPIHAGRGPGLTQRNIGQRSGAEASVLNANNLPAHHHSLTVATSSVNVAIPASDGVANGNNPEETHLAESSSGNIYTDGATNVTLKPFTATGTVGGVTDNTGASTLFNNMQPWECVNYIIALFGSYPSRN